MSSAAASASPGVSTAALNSHPAAQIAHALPPLVINTASSSFASANSSHGSILTADARELALPSNRMVDASLWHLLIAEMQSCFEDSTANAQGKQVVAREELREVGLVPVEVGGSSSSKQGSKATSHAGSLSRVINAGSGTAPILDVHLQSEVSARMEAAGFHIGGNIAERLSALRPPLHTTLDVLKFLCKDIWMAVWEKQVDNLRTNHKGVYVLQDNAFRPLVRMSTSGGPGDTVKRSESQLSLAIGIIRGVLSRLGIPSTVVVETSQYPHCTFHVKTPQLPAQKQAQPLSTSVQHR